MTRIKHYRLELQVQTPFITHGNNAAAFGLDAVMARNADGKPMIAGTLVAGRLKHAWTAWGPQGAKFLRLLGEKPKDGDYEPARKALLLDDLLLQDVVLDGALLTRIRLDGDTRAAARGALLIAEQAAAPGETLNFHGIFRLICPDSELAETCNAISAALAWDGQIGAESAVGYGRIESIQIHPLPPAQVSGVSLSVGTRFGLQLELDRPFCVAEKNRSNNLFIGREVIPGGAFKGALATSWAALLDEKNLKDAISSDFDVGRAALSQYFSELACGHAFPLREGKRAVSLPQSLACAEDGLPQDMAGEVDAARIEGKAPAFQIDWKGKHYAVAKPAFGWHPLRREVRVRTAIDRSTKRAADSELFAYDCVAPRQGERWGLNISLERIPETAREAVREDLQSLLSALGGEVGWLGKTKAFARVQLGEPLPTWREEAPADTASPVRLLLQTDALIGDWNELDESAGAEALAGVYEAAFLESSNRHLILKQYFARQKLVGGQYLHGRHGKDKPYRPWLLTEAGSVFVLEAVKGHESEAGKILARWRSQGLPLPGWIEREIQASGQARWKVLPYLPEAGYGEVLINPDTQIAKGEAQ